MTVKREKPILSLPILLPLLTVEYQFLNRKRKELWTQISFVHRLRETRKLILPVKSWRFRNGEENFRLEFLIKREKKNYRVFAINFPFKDSTRSQRLNMVAVNYREIEIARDRCGVYPKEGSRTGEPWVIYPEDRARIFTCERDNKVGYERCSKCSGHGSTTDTKEKRRSPVNGFVLRGTQVTRYTGCSRLIFTANHISRPIIPALLLLLFLSLDPFHNLNARNYS